MVKEKILQKTSGKNGDSARRLLRVVERVLLSW
jgi:hypothetical protein